MREEDFDVNLERDYRLASQPTCSLSFHCLTKLSNELSITPWHLTNYLILSFIIDQNNIVYKDISHYI